MANHYYDGYYGYEYRDANHAYDDGFNRGCETAALAALEIGLAGRNQRPKRSSHNYYEDNYNGSGNGVVVFDNGGERMNIYRNQALRAAQRGRARGGEYRNAGYGEERVGNARPGGGEYRNAGYGEERVGNVRSGCSSDCRSGIYF